MSDGASPAKRAKSGADAGVRNWTEKEILLVMRKANEMDMEFQKGKHGVKAKWDSIAQQVSELRAKDGKEAQASWDTVRKIYSTVRDKVKRSDNGTFTGSTGNGSDVFCAEIMKEARWCIEKERERDELSKMSKEEKEERDKVVAELRQAAMSMQGSSDKKKKRTSFASLVKEIRDE